MDQLLRDLIHAHGVSGSESPVRELIEKAIKPYVSEVGTDKMGNCIAVRTGAKPKIMLAAHMDEVGLIVKSMTPEGRISFTAVGGLDPLTLVGQRAHLQAEREVVHGIVTTAEMIDGNLVENLPKFHELFIDTGLDKAELEARGVTVGSVIDLDQESGVLGNQDHIYGKALDDRIGCYILIEVAKRLAKSHGPEIAFVFTVQEEIGMYGAVTSAYEINPDWAVVVDVTNSYEAKGLRIVGKGPCLTVKDASMIGSPQINAWLRDAAKRLRIPVQLDVSDMGTSDALGISISKGGVPVTTFGVAVKNLHSTVGMASLRDIEQAVSVLTALVAKPPKDAA